MTQLSPYAEFIRKGEWGVFDAPFEAAKELVKAYHYAKGTSNTFVFCHGLYSLNDLSIHGALLWMPPTRPAAMSVCADPNAVLALSRMVVSPGTPKGACSFLVSRSVKIIRRTRRFKVLLAYSDEFEGHTGAVYLACGWKSLGPQKPTPVWLDADGKRVSPKATVNRTRVEMEALGHRLVARSVKHKYVKHLEYVK